MFKIRKAFRDVANRFNSIFNWVSKEYDSGYWHVIEYHNGEVELFYRKEKASFTKESNWGDSYYSAGQEVKFPVTLSKVVFCRGSMSGSYSYSPDITGTGTDSLFYRMVSYAHNWNTLETTVMFYVRGKLGGVTNILQHLFRKKVCVC